MKKVVIKSKSKTSRAGKSPKGGSKSGPSPGSSKQLATLKKGPVKKDDLTHDLEQQFLLRLPPGPAMALRREVEAGAMNLKDKLFIELSDDMRQGKVTYGGQMFSAKMMDLPTISECLKTTDRKTFYKTADLSQILICPTGEEDSPDESETLKKKDKDKKYQYNHGITPPLKNVRKRRFRKVLKKKYQEQPDIEKEVKRLFRMDNEAISVEWEVVVDNDDSEKGEGGGEGGEKVLAHGETTGGDMQQMNNDLSQLAAIFGDISDSSEDEKDINIMDSGAEDDSKFSPGGMNDTNMSNMSMDGDSSNLHLQLQVLGKQLEALQDKRNAIQIEKSMEDDPSAKARLEAQEQALLGQETSKKNEYEILASMLNQ